MEEKILRVNSLQNKYLLFSVGFLLVSLLWPIATEGITFDIIVKIRQAIHSGDSGDLIIAALISCILFTVPSMFLYLSLAYLTCFFEEKIKLTVFWYNALLFITFMFIRWLLTHFFLCL